jgi:Leucine-rich repeat (LRR) protein
MQGNALVGFVPSEIGSFLKRLTLLDLSRNLLTGAIPENLADLPKLKELYLHNNQFIGGTPAKLVARNVTVFVR